MSELLDKQSNAQNESLKNSSRVHASSHKPMKKVCDENERNKQEKNHARIKMLFVEERFTTPIPKTGETNLHEL